jgi:hypothetical protein
MLQIALLVSVFVGQGEGLSDLQLIFDAASKPPNYNVEKLMGVNEAVLGLIRDDKLRAPADFMKASALISDWRNTYETLRVKHELCLVALAGGDKSARTEVKKTWDALLISTGREQRVGTMLIPGEARFKVAPSPKSIRNVMLDPDKAVTMALSAKSDAEVTKICADDQAAREMDFSKATMKQIEDMSKGDKKRLARMVQLLEVGRVVTSEDFDHASLVLQHGSTWKDYSLAHELSICTLLLDSKKSAWLTAATYDRMLGSGGYRQRFGTQYISNAGSKFFLAPVDETAINDTERKIMKCPTLEKARNRKWD